MGAAMDAATRPQPAPPRLPRRPPLAAVATHRRRARLHLLTYLVGNALFWASWASISVTADTWYWWVTVPLAGWTVVLALHLLRAYRLTP